MSKPKVGILALAALTALVLSMVSADGAVQQGAVLDLQGISDIVEGLPPVSESLAGIWLTTVSGVPILHLGYTDSSPSDVLDETVSMLEKAGIPAQQLSVDREQFTTAELLNFYNDMNKLAAGGEFNDTFSSFGVNASRNSIAITPADKAVSLEEAASLVGPSVPGEAIEIEPAVALTTATSVYDYPPYFAGLRIRDMTSTYTGYCTSGFVFWNGSSDWRAGSTAGHCTKNDADVYSGPSLNKYVGWGAHNLFRGDTALYYPIDASLIPLNDWSDATRKIYPGPTLVSGRTHEANLILGFDVCEWGQASSSVNCGPIDESWPTTINMSFHNINTDVLEYRLVYNEACWKALGAQGDSGGPVFHQMADGTVHAAAVMGQARYTLDSEGNWRYYDSCGAAVEAVENATGYDVWHS